MIKLCGIKKYFHSNGVMALENANFTLNSGEIHALLGENGSGKSTLMHVLAGFFPPSSGTILINGRERHFASTADALALGIGMVRQQPGFLKGLKVWEDCILGAENPAVNVYGFPTAFRSLFFNPVLLKKRVKDLSVLWSFDLPLDEETSSLTVNQRMKAAVLSLLLRNVRWFIFDEPTAVLSEGETKNLYDLLHRLRNEGKGIILITHKLDEALKVSDRVTVMRHGVTAESWNTGEFSINELKGAIFGERTGSLPHSLFPITQPSVSAKEKPVLSIRNFSLSLPGLPRIRNINLNLMPGKILGIAGVRDSGLEVLEFAIAGLLDIRREQTGKCEGSILLNDQDITGRDVRSFREAGGAYLGADRLGGSLAWDLPLSESLFIHVFRRTRLGIFLNIAALKSWGRKIMNKAGISRSISNMAYSFSGGMIQRVLLAREIAEEPNLLVLSEPGSSLDEKNLLKLADELRTFVEGGSSVLLFSSDLDELHLLADKVLLLKNGILIKNGNGDEN